MTKDATWVALAPWLEVAAYGPYFLIMLRDYDGVGRVYQMGTKEAKSLSGHLERFLEAAATVLQ